MTDLKELKMEKVSNLRALIIAPTPTWPLNYGNRKRIYSVCSKLKDLGFEIHYVHYASEGDWRDHVPFETRKKMDEQWDLVDHVWPSKPLHDWPKEGSDHLIDEWWDWSLENHLVKTFQAREYDLCITNYTWLSKALELAPAKTFKVLDTHDKFSGRRDLLASNGIAQEFFHTTEEQEIKGLDRADLVWAIKEEEQHAFVDMGTKANVSTLLHIDDRRVAKSPDVKNGTVFGFIGADNSINKVNISRFIEVATPIFKKYCAPIVVEIAGSICRALNIKDNPFFKTVGYVNDIDEFYDGIHAAIIPMEFSTGLKIKVAEALSHSKPMLAHEHAMEGFSPKHSLHELATFEEMALAMVELSYETSELAYLEDASVSSYKVTEDAIWEELNSLKTIIEAKKSIFVLLPNDYGDKRKLAHFVAQAKIDLLHWNWSEVTYFTLANKAEPKSYYNFVRVVDKDSFEGALRQFKPKLLLNLSEEFYSVSVPDDVSVVSLTCVNHLNRDNALQYNSHSHIADDKYFPSIGHIKLESPALKNVIDECWILGEIDSESTKLLLGIVSQDLYNRKLSIERISDIDDILIEVGALPKLIFVSSENRKLNHGEQILLEIAEKYDIEIRNNFINQLLISKPSNQKGNYEKQFFSAWQNFLEKINPVNVRLF